jgi:hypothetical protein
MKIPMSQHTTSAAIVKWYESKPQEHRPHMGASLIGHDCERYIWNTWRWALKPSFPGRILRLFSSGVREEPRLIEELRGIGATVWETDPDTGAQWRVSACNGHFGGSLDGVAQGVPEAPKTPCVLEFKTHNDKSFTALVAKKVKEAKPQHYDQMQVYMGLMQIDRALYMGVNKNTDDVHTEWVHFDEERFKHLLLKAQRLIDMTEPPQRLSEDPAHWQCKMCNFHPVCHGDKAAEANCRTCCHATPATKAEWKCEAKGVTLNDAMQKAGCSQHLMIPALVPYATPTDGGDNYVIYTHKASGKQFSNGPGPEPRFSSRELEHCPGLLIEDVGAMKEVFTTAKVVKPTVVDPWPDMPSDDLDAIPTKRDTQAVREKKTRISKSLDTLRSFQP